MKRFHSYGSVICRRKASFLLLRDDVGGSDNGGEPKRPFQQILHSIYGWAHLCIIKGTSYKVKNYRKTGMLPIPESLLLKKRTEMDDDSTKIHDNLVRHEKTYIQIPSHLRCFLYMKEFSLFLFSSYRPRLGLLGVGTNQRVSRVLKPLHRCDLGKAILKIFCVGVELSLSWSEKRDDIDAPNNDRDVSWRSTTPSRADCAPLLHQTPTTQVGKSGCSSFLLASEKTLLHHPSQIKRFTFFLPALFL